MTVRGRDDEPTVVPAEDGGLARLKLDVAERAAVRRYHLLEQVVGGLKVAVWIIVSWVPLQLIERMARDIAGKSTNFSATVSITVTLTILLSIGWGISARKSHLRKKKLQRLRDRTEKLEAELARLKRVESQGEPA